MNEIEKLISLFDVSIAFPANCVIEAKEQKEIILEALKKQNPIKPIEKGCSFYCPCCDMGVVREEYSWSSEETTIFHEDFCEWCGQAIDWTK
jgi:ferredoxin